MEPARLVVAAVLALPAGYFTGILIDRIPGGEPLGTDLPPFRLTGRYLAAHVLVLAGFLISASRFDDQPWADLLPMAIFVVSGVALSLIDLDCMRLPDRLVVPTFLLLVVVITVSKVAGSDAKAIQTALAGAGMFFGILLFFHLLFGNRGLGFGDVKAAAILGLMLGWVGPPDFTRVLVLVVYSIMVGFGSSVVVGLGLWVIRGRSRGYPLGPFLMAGTFFVLYFAHPILYG